MGSRGQRNRTPARPATAEARLWKALELLAELEKLNVLSPSEVMQARTMRGRVSRAWHEARRIGSSEA